MKQELIINGKSYGVVVKYVQRRERLFPCWDFLMEGTSINIEVPMFKIKSFTSDGNLEIVTYLSNTAATA